MASTKAKVIPFPKTPAQPSQTSQLRILTPAPLSRRLAALTIDLALVYGVLFSLIAAFLPADFFA